MASAATTGEALTPRDGVSPDALEAWRAAVGDLPAHGLEGATYGINLGLQISLIVMICVCAVSILADLWRLSRPGPAATPETP